MGGFERKMGKGVKMKKPATDQYCSGFYCSLSVFEYRENTLFVSRKTFQLPL